MFRPDLYGQAVAPSLTVGVEGNPMRLLLVEDDPRIASFVRRGLTQEGFVVDHAFRCDATSAMVECFQSAGVVE